MSEYSFLSLYIYVSSMMSSIVYQKYKPVSPLVSSSVQDLHLIMHLLK